MINKYIVPQLGEKVAIQSAGRSQGRSQTLIKERGTFPKENNASLYIIPDYNYKLICVIPSCAILRSNHL